MPRFIAQNDEHFNPNQAANRLNLHFRRKITARLSCTFTPRIASIFFNLFKLYTTPCTLLLLAFCLSWLRSRCNLEFIPSSITIMLTLRSISLSPLRFYMCQGIRTEIPKTCAFSASLSLYFFPSSFSSLSLSLSTSLSLSVFPSPALSLSLSPVAPAVASWVSPTLSN